jgi:hypothetical protein
MARPFPRSLSGCAEREDETKGAKGPSRNPFRVQICAALACNRIQLDAINRANQPGFFISKN